MKSSNTELSWDHSKKFNFYSKGMFTSEWDIDPMYETIEMIPDTAKVSASGNFSPHLADREYCYYFPRVENANYIVVLLNGPLFGVTDAEFFTNLNRYIFNPEWSVAKLEGPVLLLKKEPAKENLINDWLIDFEQLTADSNNFVVTGSKQVAEGGRYRSHEVTHSGIYSIKLSPQTNQIGPVFKVDSVFPGDFVHVSIRKKGGQGILIVCDENNGFNVAAQKGSVNNGWELQTVDLWLRNPLANNRLLIYGNNPENTEDVYFDDLHIQIFHSQKKQE
jgi:hypothetical protein